MLFILSALALAAPLTAEDAVEAALASSPELTRAQADLDRARGEVQDTALFLRNPSIDVEYALSGERLAGSITQPISVTGEGLAAGRAARSLRDAATLLVERAELEVAADARLAWVDAVVARERSRLALDAARAATRLREAAQVRLGVGDGSLLDVRLARAEEARAVRDLLLAHSAEADAMVRLATLVGGTPGQIELSADPLSAAPAPAEATGGARADVRAAESGVQAARADLARARAATLPALELGAFYEADEGGAAIGPAVGIEIPLWNRNRGPVGAARGDLAVAEVGATARAWAAAAELETTARVLDEARTAVEGLGPGLVDEAAAGLVGVETAYVTGQINLADASFLRARLVEGQVAWLEARAAYAHARIAWLLAREDGALLGG